MMLCLANAARQEGRSKSTPIMTAALSLKKKLGRGAALSLEDLFVRYAGGDSTGDL